MVLRSSRALRAHGVHGVHGVHGALGALGAACLLLVLSSGCKASLFDDGKQGSDNPDVVGAECPAECLGDAARDFDGTAGGAGGHWRYLDDHRDRTWAPMTGSAAKMTGADPATAISKCAPGSTAPACAELPGALLISTAGASSAADPALEFTVTTKRVVKLGVRAFVPTTAPEQQVRIYRNSREDLLFAGPAAAGALFEKAVSVDAIPGDRLLVALSPASGGATDVGLELFVSDVGTPTSCQVALTFDDAAGTTVPAACGAAFESYTYMDTGADLQTPPTLAAGPYPDLGKAAVFVETKYYKGTEILNKAGDVTLQYWMRVDSLSANGDGWPFSDEDLNNGGGIGNAVYTRAETRFDTQIGTANVTYVGANAPHAYAGAWEFVRLVHSGGKVATCIDGKRLTSFDLPAGKLNSAFPPYLGKNVQWTPAGAYFIGSIDDFRVLSVALPCE